MSVNYLPAKPVDKLLVYVAQEHPYAYAYVQKGCADAYTADKTAITTAYSSAVRLAAESASDFVDRIEPLCDINESPRELLLEMVPMCLKDQASFWHSLFVCQEKRDMTTWNHWRQALEKAVFPDPSELHLNADSRKGHV